MNPTSNYPQDTEECPFCYGRGYVKSFYRKKDEDVIECLHCFGLGYVPQKDGVA